MKITRSRRAKAAGTPEWNATAAPYLKTCEFKSWDEVMGK